MTGPDAPRSQEAMPEDLRALAPRGAVVLRRLATKRKSTVLVLGSDAGPLLAKRAATSGLRCERDVYDSVLPSLGLRGPRVRGWSESTGVAWLLLDYVEGHEADPWRGPDKDRISRWAARLHSRSRRVRFRPPAPPRGRPDPLDRLRELRAVIQTDTDRSDRQWALDACDEVAASWSRVQRAERRLEPAFTHADLGAPNMLIEQGSSDVVVVDWEQAAWTRPTLDLAVVDVDVYCRTLVQEGEQADPETLRQGCFAGGVLASLAHDVPTKRAKVQRRYLNRMLRGVRTLPGGEGA